MKSLWSGHENAESDVLYMRRKGICAEASMGQSGLVLRLDMKYCVEAKHILYNV